jgi:hypothetical protein
VTKKSAGYTGRPRSSTGRRWGARTLISLACNGGRNLRSIEGPLKDRKSTRYHTFASTHERKNHGRQHTHLCNRDRGTRSCRYRCIHEGQVASILSDIAESPEDLA